MARKKKRLNYPFRVSVALDRRQYAFLREYALIYDRKNSDAIRDIIEKGMNSFKTTRNKEFKEDKI